MSNRKIYICGEINSEAYQEFSEKLTTLEEESNEPIEIELNSGGGVAYDGLAFYSRIRISSCPINIRAYGLVASAASIILVGGTTRSMAREGWFMVHEDGVEVSGLVSETERELEHFRRMENQWNAILARHTKVSAKVWASMNLETTYLSAKECLEMGVVDKII